MAASVCSRDCTHKLWEKYSSVKEGELGLTLETTVLKFNFYMVVVLPLLVGLLLKD